MTSDSIVIVGFSRTPMGAFQGKLSTLSAPTLGSLAISAAIKQSGISKDIVTEVMMGCVLSAGLGQAPARQASLQAGLSDNIGCTTLNKICGSGMKTIMLASDLLRVGYKGVMVTGGFESMSNAPYLLDKARSGYRMGHQQVKDHMLIDGLEDAYEKGKAMGLFAEATAEKYGFSREEQDAFALTSLTRAKEATQNGSFRNEITPVTVKIGKEMVTVTDDETPTVVKPEKIPQLRPAFKENGTVTAANSSSISDGAASIILMREEEAKSLGITPLARIVGHASFAHAPSWFTTAPVGAIQKLIGQINWDLNSVDLFEINEAFAVVTMAALHDLKLPHEKVNIYGGACALGHPIGASGARIVCTLVSALQQQKKTRGIAALCIGGGEATAIAIECL